MCALGSVPSVSDMNILKSLHWPLILGLGALALLRPLIKTVGDQYNITVGPVTTIIATLVISAVWVATVGFSEIARPVLTLLFTGLTYALLSVILSAVLSPILTGELQGPLSMPLAFIPLLFTNAIWGLVTGGLALLIQRARGIRPTGNVPPR